MNLKLARLILHVCLKISFLCERFSTNFALKRLIVKMNSNVELRIAKSGESFFADKAGETLAESACFLIHNEAALQSFFYLLSIIFFNLNLALLLICIFNLLISLLAGGCIFQMIVWNDYVHVCLTGMSLIISLEFLGSICLEFSFVLFIERL